MLAEETRKQQSAPKEADVKSVLEEIGELRAKLQNAEAEKRVAMREIQTHEEVKNELANLKKLYDGALLAKEEQEASFAGERQRNATLSQERQALEKKLGETKAKKKQYKADLKAKLQEVAQLRSEIEHWQGAAAQAAQPVATQPQSTAPAPTTNSRASRDMTEENVPQITIDGVTSEELLNSDLSEMKEYFVVLEAEKKELKTRNEELQLAYDLLMKKEHKLKESLYSLEQDHARKIDDLAQKCGGDMKQLQAKIEQLTAQNAEAQKREEGQQASMKALKQSVAEMNDEIVRYQNLAAQHEKQIKDLEGEKTEALKKLAQLDALTIQNKSLAERLQLFEKNDRRDDDQKRLAELLSENQHLQEKHQQAAAEVKNLKESDARTQAQMGELVRKRDELALQLQKALDQVQQLDKAIEEGKNHAATLENEKKAIQEEFGSFKRDTEKHRSEEIDVFRKQLQALEASKVAVEGQLQAAKAEHEQQLRGLAQGASNDAKKALADLEAQLVKVTEEHSQLQKTAAQEQQKQGKELGEVRQRAEEAEKKQKVLSSELDSLKQDMKNLEAERNSLAEKVKQLGEKAKADGQEQAAAQILQTKIQQVQKMNKDLEDQLVKERELHEQKLAEVEAQREEIFNEA